MWMSGPHLRSHPMSLPTRTRSDTRNSYQVDSATPIGWSFVFSPCHFFVHRQTPKALGHVGVLVARGNRGRDAVSVNTRERCHALLPARAIAGHPPPSGVVASARDRAPWVGIRRLRIASLRFASNAAAMTRSMLMSMHITVSLPVVGQLCGDREMSAGRPIGHSRKRCSGASRRRAVRRPSPKHHLEPVLQESVL
jgi:hypothetical protein